MDLAASSESASGKTNGPHCNLMFGKAERPTGRGGSWRGYAGNNEVEPERYCLDIRGHSSSQYPVIEDFEKQFDQLFQRSLACAQPEFLPFSEAMGGAMPIDLVHTMANSVFHNWQPAIVTPLSNR